MFHVAEHTFTDVKHTFSNAKRTFSDVKHKTSRGSAKFLTRKAHSLLQAYRKQLTHVRPSHSDTTHTCIFLQTNNYNLSELSKTK